MPLRLLFAFFMLIFCATACRSRKKEISFYYWRTTFHLDSLEKETLANNSVGHLYVRYFDIDFSPADPRPRPIGVIQFDSLPGTIKITPVVYIKNRVFEKLNIDSLFLFAKNVFGLVRSINQLKNISCSEMQFDCDWTEKTRDKYFSFLRLYKKMDGGIISSTIRLHQVKSSDRMGIPPVDYGVLMFYNMGNIDAGLNNSVYDKSISEKYSPSVKKYPLALDLALPVFTWALQMRAGKVIRLLNKMSFTHFENDSNFTRLNENRYLVRRPGFLGGYYFRDQDSVKVEHVSKEDILSIADQVNHFSNGRIRNLIFYDLDRRNLTLYEKNIFKEISDYTD